MGPLPGGGTGNPFTLGLQKVETILANLLRSAYSIQQAIAGQFGNASFVGYTSKHYDSAASTNATSVTAVATTLFSAQISNSIATVYYFKVYDKATAPTVGTDVPVHTQLCKASDNTIVSIPTGIKLTNGLAWALTAGIANTDVANAVTGLSINLGYV